ncbi:mRNA (2'-O-methyladenosine-N(6)-)-methyltransferase [Malassezia psittaci]|uniref:mRNA m(6)A methyltransferase n=1 Tax=Malassezia psittaci TaxID=1821823 RepID=A0AAF0JM10_9BASI|nr:mRNA (2'-O-methyladenosine-N(6)-)-methyltransferase [Malassezia psittaci]
MRTDAEVASAAIAKRYLRPLTAKEVTLARLFLHFELEKDVNTVKDSQIIDDTPKYLLYSQDWLRLLGWEKIESLKSQREAQWISCDLRTFDLSSIGEFDVIVADPPWDIHMSLPYGTLSDEQMYALQIPQLQKQGLLFLWVTGRAMELGRALLKHWGYLRMDELVWIKINQLHRLIRTGRTGHWLNHTKEHCLVGYKSPSLSQTDAPTPGMYLPLPESMHPGLGNDVIVAPVRDTSRKPDELYTMIEKMCPGGRFIELFGRQHNVRPKWLTLGNQLQGNHLVSDRL